MIGTFTSNSPYPPIIEEAEATNLPQSVVNYNFKNTDIQTVDGDDATTINGGFGETLPVNSFDMEVPLNSSQNSTANLHIDLQLFKS